jgi:hypothetical protein
MNEMPQKPNASVRAAISVRPLAPTPGKGLEPASTSCAARPELNTIAERHNMFAGAPFDLVKNGKNDQEGFPLSIALEIGNNRESHHCE